VAGFQAWLEKENETLGRVGSDTQGRALACLKATSKYLYRTWGIYSADPALCDE